MIDKLVLALVVIGALNWGSIGLFQFDLVAAVFGGQAAIFSRIVYTLVALAGSGPFPFSSVTRLHTIRQQGNDIVKDKKRTGENFSGPFCLLLFFSLAQHIFESVHIGSAAAQGLFDVHRDGSVVLHQQNTALFCFGRQIFSGQGIKLSFGSFTDNVSFFKTVDDQFFHR